MSAVKRAQVTGVLDALAAVYGVPAGPTRRPPVDSLVATILSQNTSDANSHRAFRSLKAAFLTWEDVMQASDGEVAQALRSGGLAHQKAARIRAILALLAQRWGSVTLAPLEDMDNVTAMVFLMSLKGVGPKTAACVLLFSLGRKVFPVDTHIFRVTGRLGWLPAKANPDAAHDLLARVLPSRRYYEAHINLIAHGRKVCRARSAQCTTCPVAPLCPFSGA